MNEPCAWLTYDAHGNEYVFADYQDAERFVGDSEDAEIIHPLVMFAEVEGLRIELDLHRNRIAELERQLADAEAVKKQLQRDAERWRECERLVLWNPGNKEWVIPVSTGDTFESAVDDSIKRREQA